MMLTPKDQRTVLDALIHATANMQDRVSACAGCGGTGSCEACGERFDKITEYDDLAARIRSEP